MCDGVPPRRLWPAPATYRGPVQVSSPVRARPLLSNGAAAGAVGAALLLVAAAAVVGARLTATGTRLFLGAPPLFAQWQPHTGPGTIPVVLLAAAGVVLSRRAVDTLRTGTLLAGGYAVALGWTFLLDAVDRSQRAFGAPLADPNEYLADLPRITSVSGFLRTFTDHIIDFRPGSWTTHVSSHPPLATLFFWALDRLGMAGAGWAGIWVIVIGCTVTITVPVTLRLVGSPAAARRVVPFLVFTPSAVWVGTSADGMFAGVAAAAIAVLTLAATRRRPWAAATLGAAGGVLAAATVFLSYGLAVLVVPAAALLVLTRRRAAGWALAWGTACGAAGAVFALFAAGGFWWPQGLSLLHTRYYQGIAAQRPYGYFVWADLAALTVSAGPVLAVSLTVAARRIRAMDPVAVLVAAAALAVLVADLSGLSKAETERIWLPFVPWLMGATGLLKGRMTWWLCSIQIITALAVNHLLLTHW